MRKINSTEADLVEFVTEGQRFHDQLVGAYDAMDTKQRYFYGGDTKSRALVMKTISLIASDDLAEMREQKD